MAISSPLLEASIDGAHGVLLSIQGGSDLGLFEINEAAQLVANSAAPDANIIFGAVIDDALGDEVRVTVIAAGFDEAHPARARSSRAGTLQRGAGQRGQSRGNRGLAHLLLPGPHRAASGRGGAAAHARTARPACRTGRRPARRPARRRPARRRVRRRLAPAPPVSRRRPAPAEGIPSPRPDAPPPRLPSRTRRRQTHVAAAARVAQRPAHGLPDGSTRRRSVVFEEDDDLDVPDFLK